MKTAIRYYPNSSLGLNKGLLVERLEKSKILITCQKNTFGELSSKMLLKLSGILLFSRNSEKTVLVNRLCKNQAQNKHFERAYF